MPNLSIKGVPEEIAKALHARAARNHRSLQGELLDIVTRAALQPMHPAEASGLGTRMTQTHADRRTGPGKTIEQIAREHSRRLPIPLTDPPRAVDIVRKARDAR